MFGVSETGGLGSSGRLSVPSVIIPPPAFVPLADGVAADIYMDFVNKNYWGSSPTMWNFSRASVAWGDNQAGVWSQFANNVPVITNKGLVINPAGTNLALWCRDFTNAAWVKTGCTAALTATGIDGTANSASLITAGGTGVVNATVLQSITNASATTIAAFFLKRATGTGIINITTDGGTTWKPVTLTAAFTRQFVNQAAVTNPSIGIQIVTGGDAVVVDFAQCEAIAAVPTATPSPPVLTTTAPATRAGDIALIRGVAGSSVTLLATATPIASQFTMAGFLAISDTTTNNRFYLARAATVARVAEVIGGTATNLNGAAWADVQGKLAATAASGALALSFNAGTVVTGAPVGYPAGLSQIAPAIFAGASAWVYITSIAVWLNHQATNAALQALTTATTMVSTAIQIGGQASNVSIHFPTTVDANSLVGPVTVTSNTGAPYAGVITIASTGDGPKFALDNSGNYPCNLLIGTTSIGAGSYSISLTATP
jgi:hypothetical protein